MMEVRDRSTCEIFDGSLSKFAKFAWHLRANASIMLVAYVTTFSSHRSFSSSYLHFLFAFGMMLGRLNATPLLLLCILSPFSTLSHGRIFALPCAFSQQLKHPCRIFTCKVGEGPFCTPVHVGFGSASINSCYHLRDDGIRTPSRPIRVCQRPHLPCLHHGSKKKKRGRGAFTLGHSNARPRMPPFSPSDRWWCWWHETLLAWEASFSASEAPPHLSPPPLDVVTSCRGATRRTAARLLSSFPFRKLRRKHHRKHLRKLPRAPSCEPFVNFLSFLHPPSSFEVNSSLTERRARRGRRVGISFVSSSFWRPSATFVASRSTWTRPFRPCLATEAIRKDASASWTQKMDGRTDATSSKRCVGDEDTNTCEARRAAAMDARARTWC